MYSFPRGMSSGNYAHPPIRTTKRLHTHQRTLSCCRLMCGGVSNVGGGYINNNNQHQTPCTNRHYMFVHVVGVRVVMMCPDVCTRTINAKDLVRINIPWSYLCWVIRVVKIYFQSAVPQSDMWRVCLLVELCLESSQPQSSISGPQKSPSHM